MEKGRKSSVPKYLLELVTCLNSAHNADLYQGDCLLKQNLDLVGNQPKQEVGRYGRIPTV